LEPLQLNPLKFEKLWGLQQLLELPGLLGLSLQRLSGSNASGTTRNHIRTIGS